MHCLWSGSGRWVAAKPQFPKCFFCFYYTQLTAKRGFSVLFLFFFLSFFCHASWWLTVQFNKTGWDDLSAKKNCLLSFAPLLTAWSCSFLQLHKPYLYSADSLLIQFCSSSQQKNILFFLLGLFSASPVTWTGLSKGQAEPEQSEVAGAHCWEQDAHPLYQEEAIIIGELSHLLT